MKQWGPDVLRGFWERWYFPANATLYVVGELGGSVEETRQLIERTFGRVPPGRYPAHSLNGNGHADAPAPGSLKMRHEVRATLPVGLDGFYAFLVQTLALSGLCEGTMRVLKFVLHPTRAGCGGADAAAGAAHLRVRAGAQRRGQGAGVSLPPPPAAALHALHLLQAARRAHVPHAQPQVRVVPPTTTHTHTQLRVLRLKGIWAIFQVCVAANRKFDGNSSGFRGGPLNLWAVPFSGC